MTHEFKNYLAQVARAMANVLSEFEEPPEFDLWHNPVAASAQRHPLLGSGSRELNNDRLFTASGARNLCDDSRHLLDGEITRDRRLWLLYRYHSLTDFDGNDNYTSVDAVASIKHSQESTVDLHFGFHWLSDDSISRIQFEQDDSSIVASVFDPKNWFALHEKQVHLR